MSEIALGIFEFTWIGAVALFGLIVLSVWLGWKPGSRGDRAPRLRVAIPVVTLIVIGAYLALLYVPIGGNTWFGGSDVVGIALWYLTPVAVAFTAGVVAMTIVYTRAERVGVARLTGVWVLATVAVWMVAVVGVLAISAVGAPVASR